MAIGAMRRREFITLAGSALAWPLAVRAQTPAMPVIGFLNSSSPQAFVELVAGFHKGLKEKGYVEGRNIRIEYRWAKGDENRLKAMATELVDRRVALIAATGGILSARVAKEATSTIPVVFVSGSNPVQAKLVNSINRPTGNLTGVSVDTTEMVPKRLELLQELVGRRAKIAMLTSPGRTAGSPVRLTEERFAQEHGVFVLTVRNRQEFERELLDEFDLAGKNEARGLLVSADPFYFDRRDLIVALAGRHRLPAVYPWREYAAAGGLLSYGPSIPEAYRQIGIYAGLILSGNKPQDLPVVFPDKWELVINVKTATSLDLTSNPDWPWLLTRADETIE
jgi:putative ABC transport system substrate-binding protein